MYLDQSHIFKSYETIMTGQIIAFSKNRIHLNFENQSWKIRVIFFHLVLGCIQFSRQKYLRGQPGFSMILSDDSFLKLMRLNSLIVIRLKSLFLPVPFFSPAISPGRQNLLTALKSSRFVRSLASLPRLKYVWFSNFCCLSLQ